MIPSTLAIGNGVDGRLARACDDIQRSADALVEAEKLRAQRRAFERSLATRSIDLRAERRTVSATPPAVPPKSPPPIEPLTNLLMQLEGRLVETTTAEAAQDQPVVSPTKGMMQQLRSLLIQLEARAWWHRRGRGE